MRFMVVVAEIIGNLSAPAAGSMAAGTVDVGSPVYLAIWEILTAVVRSLPCFDRTLHCLSAAAAQAVSRATRGRITLAA
jgi:hypothetical protein